MDATKTVERKPTEIQPDKPAATPTAAPEPAPEVPSAPPEPPPDRVAVEERPVAPLVAMTPEQIRDLVQAATGQRQDTSSIVPLLKDDEGNPSIPISMDNKVTKAHFNPKHGANDRICQ